MKHIGLTQRVDIIEQRHERRDCLDQAWTTLLLDLGYWPVLLPNLIPDADAAVAEFNLSGIILTGGNDLSGVPGARNTAPERDALEEKLIKICTRRNLPLLGICRGLELLNVHYGGGLMPVKHHVAVMHEIHPVKNAPVVLRSHANSFHDFGITADVLSPLMAALGHAPDGSVEAAKHNIHPQWGIMWHPERGPKHDADGQLIKAIFS